jgi:small subunit ribosomal protein S9
VSTTAEETAAADEQAATADPAEGTGAATPTEPTSPKTSNDRKEPNVSTAAPIAHATGRRKRAVARVRIRPGGGAITVNGHKFEEYFTSATHRMIVTEPLRLTDSAESWAIDVTIDGGGVSGQAGAFRLGIARVLCELDPELRVPLKRAGFLTRDSREKESKKYGLKKARKAPQYSKR